MYGKKNVTLKKMTFVKFKTTHLRQAHIYEYVMQSSKFGLMLGTLKFYICSLFGKPSRALFC